MKFGIPGRTEKQHLTMILLTNRWTGHNKWWDILCQNDLSWCGKQNRICQNACMKSQNGCKTVMQAHLPPLECHPSIEAKVN